MAEREEMKMNGHREAALILGAGQRKVISFVCFGRLAANMTPAVTGQSPELFPSTGLQGGFQDLLTCTTQQDVVQTGTR